MARRLAISCLISIFTSQSAFAECGKPDPANGISADAMQIIGRQGLRKVEAGIRIDRETAQILLGRIFDPKTGKQRNLPPPLLEQYRRDAHYFADILRKEGDEARARFDEALKKAETPCSTQKP